MSRKDTLTLTRIGEFAFKTVGNNHCGIAPAGQIQRAAYEVTVCCLPVLDKRDYLFEQRTVDAFFQTINNVSMSCEKLTIDTTHRLLDILLRENPGLQVRWIRTIIRADPYKAWMEFKYHP